MLYKTIDTASQLRNEFISYNRDNYTYEAYGAIIEYFEELEDKTELDVIAICCDFIESDKDTIISDYDIDEDESVEDFLSNNTWAAKTISDHWLYRVF